VDGSLQQSLPFSPLVRTLFIAFVRLYFRLKIIGQEHLPTQGPFILVANHSSHTDTAILFSTLPAPLRSEFWPARPATISSIRESGKL